MKKRYMYSGRGAARFEDIAIPAHTYVACGTERCKYPATIDVRLCRRSVEEWLSDMCRRRRRGFRCPTGSGIRTGFHCVSGEEGL